MVSIAIRRAIGRGYLNQKWYGVAAGRFYLKPIKGASDLGASGGLEKTVLRCSLVLVRGNGPAANECRSVQGLPLFGYALIKKIGKYAKLSKRDAQSVGL